MRHYMHLNKNKLEEIFFLKPSFFNSKTEKNYLRFALGANLYMPGTKYIAPYLLEKRYSHLTSYTMCFEDSIREKDLEIAERTVLNTLRTLKMAEDENRIDLNELPLFFIRVRNTNQFENFFKKLKKEPYLLNYISGFVFPKFSTLNAHKYLSILEEINTYNNSIYGMPILESSEIILIEKRNEELLNLKELLSEKKDLILNIRVGGTDLSSLFGLRRSVAMSIYDLGVVASGLYNIINVFSELAINDVAISGVVWEYFNSKFKNSFEDDYPKRSLIYDEEKILARTPLTNNPALDGLIREVILDKSNGFVGKTVIHPAQTSIVNAMYCVRLEEYVDAKFILDNFNNGGVYKSTSNNKMNEISPHYNWAKKIMDLASIYGVLNSNYSYLDLF